MDKNGACNMGFGRFTEIHRNTHDGLNFFRSNTEKQNIEKNSNNTAHVSLHRRNSKLKKSRIAGSNTWTLRCHALEARIRQSFFFLKAAQHDRQSLAHLAGCFRDRTTLSPSQTPTNQNLERPTSIKTTKCRHSGTRLVFSFLTRLFLALMKLDAITPFSFIALILVIVNLEASHCNQWSLQLCPTPLSSLGELRLERQMESVHGENRCGIKNHVHQEVV